MLELVLQEVTKTFESQRGTTTRAVHDVSLRVEPGEIACLVGPSGCGKTTLLNLVAGFEMPTSGEVRVGGKLVTGPGADRVVIFQDVRGSLMPWWTALQNVEFGLRLLKRGRRTHRYELARQYMRVVGLEGSEDKYPEEMSGGMQQRAQLARALVADPAVLLMDEPFGALDFLTRSRLQVLLQELHAKTPTTTVFVTHDISEAAVLGDSIWVMDANGAVVEKLSVSAPRPRSLTAPAVVAAVDRLMQLVMSEGGTPASAIPLDARRRARPKGQAA
jgi:NitT/TauT family transport system ATP-binding protein